LQAAELRLVGTQVSEVAITGDKHAMLAHGYPQDLDIRSILSDGRRPHHIMTCSGKGARHNGADVSITENFQAARAL
jgi:hypothetical protein